jgi:hypothetical protein
MIASVMGMGTRMLKAQGVIRRRLLVNALVDPEEAAARLPAGLRPHATELGTVVGRCLLDIVDLRPVGLPAATGVSVQAAASRLACEWEDDTGETVVGVYVPARFTASRLALALGGRWFPGVHQRGRVGRAGATWGVTAPGNDLRVTVVPTTGPAEEAACDPVGQTCVSASVGLSPDRRGRLEAVRMDPDHRYARHVELDGRRCDFLDGFRSARPAPSYLMETVPVSWSAEAPPSVVAAAVEAGTGAAGTEVAA